MILVWSWLAIGLAVVSAAPSYIPKTVDIDLGYTIQQGSAEITESNLRYVNFANIRYAASPTGHLRFQPPAPPLINRTVQSTGLHPVSCPNAYPVWVDLIGKPAGNLTDVSKKADENLSPPKPRYSEDCLFLDILVPKALLEKDDVNAAVLVFIHGGGFVSGFKTEYGLGVGLLEAAEKDGHDVIYVALNYRLGMFGFLAGSDEVTPNLGLQDQRFALEWIQEYIHLFRGDPESVTVMGESAGGGSIMHHLTSPLTSALLFKRIIPQSPWVFHIPPSKQKSTFKAILNVANVSSFSDLKNLTTHELQVVNALVIGNARPFGTFVFGPVIEDPWYPDLPSALLAHGAFDSSIAILGGHNANEGEIFASPFLKDDHDYSTFLRDLFPEAPESSLEILTDRLYPSNFSGVHGYTDQHTRLAKTVSDALIVCNTYFLNQAFEAHHQSVYSYLFSAPPGLHAHDLHYTFLDPNKPKSGINITVARHMQRYFVNFAVTGSPNSDVDSDDPLPVFPKENGRLIVQNFNVTGFGPIRDEISVESCKWWQKGLFR